MTIPREENARLREEIERLLNSRDGNSTANRELGMSDGSVQRKVAGVAIRVAFLGRRSFYECFFALF
jgi:hypothetical protein